MSRFLFLPFVFVGAFSLSFCAGPLPSTELLQEPHAEQLSHDGGGADTQVDASGESVQETKLIEATKEVVPEDQVEGSQQAHKVLVSEVTADAIKVHEGYLYWFEKIGRESPSGIFRIPLEGGSRQKLADIQAGYQLFHYSFQGSTLYYVEAKRKETKIYENIVHSVDLGTLSLKKALVTYENQRQIGAGFLVHDGAAYWSTQMPRVAPNFKRVSEIWKAPLQGGSVTKVVTADGWAQHFVVHAPHLYWNGAGLFRIKLEGGTLESTEWRGGHPVFLQPDGFWGVVTSGEFGDIFVYQKGSFREKPQTRFFGQGAPPTSVVRDSDAIYFIDDFAYNCRVCRVPFAGPYKPTSPRHIPYTEMGAGATLYDKITAIDVTQKHIYWYSDKTIAVSPK